VATTKHDHNIDHNANGFDHWDLSQMAIDSGESSQIPTPVFIDDLPILSRNSPFKGLSLQYAVDCDSLI